MCDAHLLGQVLANDAEVLLGLLVVGLDLLLVGEGLLQVAIQEIQTVLSVGRVLVADSQPQEVGHDGQDIVPVENEEHVSQVERLSDGQPVEGNRLVRLDLLQRVGDGGRHLLVEGLGELRDNLNDLEGSGDDEGRENDCLARTTLQI